MSNESQSSKDEFERDDQLEEGRGDRGEPGGNLKKPLVDKVPVEQSKGNPNSGVLFALDGVMLLLLFGYAIVLSIRGATVVPGVVSACIFFAVYTVIMTCHHALYNTRTGKWVELLLRLALAGGIVGVCFFPGLNFEVTYIFAGILNLNLLLGAIANFGLCRCNADKKV